MIKSKDETINQSLTYKTDDCMFDSLPDLWKRIKTTNVQPPYHFNVGGISNTNSIINDKYHKEKIQIWQ